MAIQTTYTSARANLAKLMDDVTDHNEVVIIQRRGAAKLGASRVWKAALEI